MIRVDRDPKVCGPLVTDVPEPETIDITPDPAAIASYADTVALTDPELARRLRSCLPGYCTECGREIERDNLRGKPDSHTGYCVGTDTCLRRHEIGRKVPQSLPDRPAHKGYPGAVR